MSGWFGVPIAWLCVIANLLIAWVWIKRTEVAYRREREAEERQIEAIQCAELLRQIALLSFTQQHHGTWQAWADSMGRLRVRVESQMRHPVTGEYEPDGVC